VHSADVQDKGLAAVGDAPLRIWATGVWSLAIQTTSEQPLTELLSPHNLSTTSTTKEKCAS